ncbi:restriction endonuclease subunit S [Priestia megaterium]|uniref:restriction endonuclease subunit S n=1 Tax=Priestia megaterium TaxID=1404 RepID=UPI0030005738
MAEKDKKTEIRFTGFTDAWKQRKLSDISDKVLEKNANLQFTETLTNSAEFGIISQREFFDHDISNIENLDGYYVVKNEDFVYNPRISSFAPVGPINRNKLGRTGVMSPLYTVFRTHDIDNTFLEQYFKSRYWHSFMKLNGDTGARSDRFSIKDSVFIEMPIPYPNLKEQLKIGEYLTNIDNLITLHQRKYDKLVIVKKSMLGKMFPTDGANVPEIRFAGFTDVWEQRKLGDLCQIGDIDHKMPQSVKDGVPYLMTGDFVGINDLNFKNPKLISTEDYEQLAKKIKPEAGDILFARYASVGTVRYVETQMKFLVSYSCAILKHNDISNGKYLFYYLQANEAQRQIKLALNTGSQRNIGIDSLKKLSILLPQEKEQEKVATFFTKIDNLITLQQRKIEKLKNIKKSMLEKMFV